MITVYESATHLIVTGDPKELDTLGYEFQFRPEGYFYALSYQRYQVSEGEEGWDGYIRPLQRINSTSGKILRGRKEELIRRAELLGYRINLNHLLECPFGELTVEDVRPDLIAGDFVLDDNQRRCIADWLRAGIGFNKMSVGAGKTATYAGAAALIKERFPDARFMYITPSERLVRQVTVEMRKFLPHFEVGQCGGGHREFDAKDMVVCTVAMLNKNFGALRLKHFFDSFIAVFGDECHHAPSKTSQRILLALSAYFRLGASDSGKEKNLSKWNDMQGLFGPMLNDVQSAPLIQSGRLAAPHIYIVDIGDWYDKFSHVPYRPSKGSAACMLLDGDWVQGTYRGPVYELDAKGKIKMRHVKQAEKDETGNWIVNDEPVIVSGLHRIEVDGTEHEVESRWCLLDRAYDRAIIRFKSRNDMVVAWTKYFSGKGWPTVVVATRTTHVYILEALLKKAIEPEKVNILVGEASPTERDAMFEWFKTTPGAVLISPLLKEGVSINAIRAMVVADAVAEYEIARQLIGRALRPKEEDNRAHVVMLKENQHEIMRRSSARVFKQLEQAEGFRFYHPCAGPETVFPDDFRSSPT